jgi:hypothetical protein
MIVLSSVANMKKILVSFSSTVLAHFLFIITLSAAELPTETAAFLAEKAKNQTAGYEILSSLTTEIGQRLHGTDAEKRAAEWAKKRFEAMHFDSVVIESFALANGWVRGEETAEIVSPTQQKLLLTALGESVATPTGGIEADVRIFRTYDELLQAPLGSLSHKIAVVTQKMTITQDATGYGTAAKIRTQGPSEAAKRGAVAFLLRSLSTDEHRFPHTGVTHYNTNYPQIPAAALAAPDAEQLERLDASGSVIRIHLTLTPTITGPCTSQNVIAELKGREKPGEVVLLGAHLDSWDLGTGALDDGAGVAIIMEAAQLIHQLPQHPRRTIRIVLYGSEEIGLNGGIAYAKTHTNELSKIVIAAEPDHGQGPIYRFQTGVKNTNDSTLNQIKRSLLPLGIIPGNNLSTGSSDIEPLFDAGVPVVTLEMDGTDYFNFHHTADDTLDKIVPSRLNQSTAAFVVFTYLAAELDGDYRAEPFASPIK